MVKEVAGKRAEKEKKKKKKEQEDPTATMSVVDHLRELRDRLIFSIIAIAVGAVVCFIFFEPIITLMIEPYRDATTTPLLKNGKDLIFTSPLEAFTTRIKVAAYGGFVIASPVVFFHLWRFITPGLEAKEKKYAYPFVVASVILFIGGSGLAVITFPKALNFLLKAGGENLDPLLSAGSYLTLVFLMVISFGVAFEFPIVMMFLLLARVVTTRTLRKIRKYTFLGLVVFCAIITFPKALNFLLHAGGENLDPLLSAGSYLTLVFLMVISFGVAFEFPIVMMFLLLARVVTTRTLRKIRKYTFLGLVVFCAVITPSQDPITLFAMALPMYFLYEGTIIIGRILKR